MNPSRLYLDRLTDTQGPLAGGADVVGLHPAAIEAAVRAACARIAPLWPLTDFVAVNPFLGLADRTFAEAATAMQRVAGARMTMPRAYYLERIAAGRIADADLQEAIDGCAAEADALGYPLTVARLKRLADGTPQEPPPTLATFAVAVDRARGTPAEAGLAAFAADEIAKWCAAYFDDAQSAWRMPGREGGLYAAWRAAARADRSPEVRGLAGFRAAVAALPDDPLAAIRLALAHLAVPPAAVADYVHRALVEIGGWAAYARHLEWRQAVRGGADDALVHLAAVRIAWDAALHRLHPEADIRAAWQAEVARIAGAAPRLAPDLAIDLLLQRALDAAHQRALVAQIASRGAGGSTQASPARPAMQGVFCIDVRSEVFRRALEAVAPDVETLGFAGFFGLAMEYVPLGAADGAAQCPVLVSPKVRVRESLSGASERDEAVAIGRRHARARAAQAWRAFKSAGVSCFAFVEGAGLGFAAKLLGDAFGLSRPVPHPDTWGLDAGAARRAGPRIERMVDSEGSEHADRRPGATGLTLAERVDAAAAILAGMSLTAGIARTVALFGHGSSTTNNPHAAGLDCGACGGHTGAANARAAAAIFNDPAVRAGLARRGIAIPADSWFVAGLHDTTTDEVRLFDVDRAPPSHRADLERLRERLGRAAGLARAQRTGALGIPAAAAPQIAAAMAARTRDWSQVRPEWGLAGNAAFVAAPRARTAGIDLGGRAFLHEYDFGRDRDGAVLELIMTAPLVVASWINLQYYGSTVDNAAFGSGNKVLHNVVGGTVGVVLGNGGDLRAGLPLQSVHDGRRFVHEPLRLSVFIEAPCAAMNAVLERHAQVRALLDNGWVHLFAIGDDGRYVRRYAGGLRWQAVAA